MSSTYTVSPKSLHDLREHPQGREPEPHLADARDKNHHNHNQHHPITPVDSNLLSPYSSQQYSSNTASPDVNSYTPAESTSTLGSFYQPSDFSSEFADDPFFGANFNDIETGNPAFLDDPSFHVSDSHQSISTVSPTQNDAEETPGYPISPLNSPPTYTSLSTNENANTADKTLDSIAPDTLLKYRPSVNSAESGQSSPQLTPDTNGGSWSRSSTDSLAPAITTMAPQSPRVTVSVYGRDGERSVEEAERNFPPPSESPKTVRGTHSLAGDLAVEPAYSNTTDAAADAPGLWVPDPITERRGLSPGNRPSEEILSPNQEASRRIQEEKNKEIINWVYNESAPMQSNPNNTQSSRNIGSQDNPNMAPYGDDDGIPEGEIPLGNTTENRYQHGQTYFRTDGPGGHINEIDITIMRGLRTWGDAPVLHGIQGDQQQPESSQAAIDRFVQQCQDNASIVSRAATWGTRRRSLPSLVDQEGVLSGNFLKKLNISSSNHNRRSSFLEKINFDKIKMTRKPSVSGRKRKGSNASELPPQDPHDEEERRQSKDSLAPPARTSSWGLSSGNRKPPPSLNTALVGMATGAAAIGTAHARSGSISATPVTSPKSPFGSFGTLSVPPVTLRRPRSKTELPKNNADRPSALVGMLKKQGGPPVARLAGSQPAIDVDDDDDDDDENLDDPDMKTTFDDLKDITPDVDGFRRHILGLNPTTSPYLVDRIAYQLVARYKHLCKARIDHLKQVERQACPSGVMCIASGGSAIPLNTRGDNRGVDPLSARPDSSDGDTTPLDGGITPDSFPKGIPMPPTASLPAEFECQLCFCHKKFQKPSDWTKHVHEDVQPFTCTWDCRDPKVFKRKADWVRHENEGHRHLEWWTCDVDDCRHTCYRRDNFLQHLVREHKFTEPKIKTKAAIKKSGGADPTWQKVEQCHAETLGTPQHEPCRFCGKTFTTWKKLTVHLAKHMENISLPILTLVARADLHADTIISPLQEAPPRSFPPPMVPTIKRETPAFSSSPNPDPSARAGSMSYHEHATFTNYQNIPQQPLQAPYYTQQAAQQFTDMSHPGTGLMMPQVTTGMNSQPQYQSIPVTTGPYGQQVGAYLPSQGNINQGNFQSMEQFPAFVEPDPLGIQDPTMGYDGFAGSSTMQQHQHQPIDQQYSSHGSVSPYSHSPHQGHGPFYNA